MKIAGIDIGTTTISGIVLEDKKEKRPEILETKTIQNDCFIQTGHEWERIQDAQQILKKAEALLDCFINKYPDIKRVGLTGQMHGIVYVDEQGKCVSPLYTWQDSRGNLCEDKLPLTEEIREKYKIRTASGYGIVTHIYNMRHNLVPESAVSFCTIMDCFGMYLTGRKTPLMHVSNAAGIGFFDGSKMCFETEILEKEGVHKSWLPETCMEIRELGLYKNCTVTTAIGDNQASFLGAAGTWENTALINMGTGGQISILSEKFFETDGIEARPFLDGKYLLAGASLCGGKAYALLEQFFRKFMKEARGIEEPLYEIIEKLAWKGKELNARQSENRRLKIETTFDGTRTDPEISGSVMNLFSDNFTPEYFAYGVLEGMSRELYQMYQIICQGTGIKVNRIAGAGNGLRKNPVLCEIIKEMFGAELAVTECEEEAAFGAAMSSRRH